MSETKELIVLCGNRNEEEIKRVVDFLIQQFPMARDSKLFYRAVTEADPIYLQDSGFLGIIPNGEYYGEFSSTIEKMRTAVADFERGWQASKEFFLEQIRKPLFEKQKLGHLWKPEYSKLCKKKLQDALDGVCKSDYSWKSTSIEWRIKEYGDANITPEEKKLVREYKDLEKLIKDLSKLPY